MGGGTCDGVAQGLFSRDLMAGGVLWDVGRREATWCGEFDTALDVVRVLCVEGYPDLATGVCP